MPKKIEYKKILKTNSRSDSKIEIERERRRKIAIEIVMIEDKELLELLAK